MDAGTHMHPGNQTSSANSGEEPMILPTPVIGKTQCKMKGQRDSKCLAYRTKYLFERLRFLNED
ncbi:hypothetical protein J6590_088026 [Homalodisca vitripennis]|nr:hypothetical protein J6590_088026 [Homalodisca vitripennis]